MQSVIAAIGIWLVFVLVFASLVGAQGSQGPAPASKPPAVERTEVSGKIKSVDPAGRTVLLADGTRLMIPESVGVSPADLSPARR